MLGLFSAGRSGSTWLGCLLDSHPDVTYRFEPHAQVAGLFKDAKYANALLASDRLSDSDLVSIRRGLLHSNPFIDKPPFFHKRSGALRLPGLRQALCVTARKIPLARPLYRWLYTPTASTVLVFKHVAQEDACRRLINQTSMSLVYLARHPCGTVASLLRG